MRSRTRSGKARRCRRCGRGANINDAGTLVCWKCDRPPWETDAEALRAEEGHSYAECDPSDFDLMDGYDPW